MSITLTLPAANQSLQDTLWTVASSTNSDKPDFKYVFDVYNASNQLIRVKLFPDPVSANGYFDAGPIVRNEIKYDWFIPEISVPDNPSVLSKPTNGQISLIYDIRAGEEYISGGVYVSGIYVSGGTLVTNLNLSSGQTTAYNYSAPLFKRKQLDISSMTGKYLSNRPLTANCRINGKFLIPFKTDVNRVSGFYIKLYNESNTNYATWNQTADASISELPSIDIFTQLDIGPDAINRYYNDVHGSDFITSSCKYYDINIRRNDTKATISNTYRIYIDCNPKYTPIDLYFINQWGMFDTARFDLVSRLSQEIERKSFAKKDWNTSGTSVNYYDNNEVYNESKINYGSKINWTYKLTMNYPTDEEYEWLAELVDSPQIYADIDGDYYPVTIKATNYEYSKHIFNNLKTFEVEIELNQTRYGFRR